MTTQAVPIFLDIRHGIASISRRLKLNLRQTALSFGTDPRVTSRVLVVRPNRRITASGVSLETGGDLSGNVSSDCSGRASPSRSERSSGTHDAKRRRNADGVLDRDSVLHMRKVRNRESAARTNEARKRKIEDNRRELENLKKNKVPALKLKEQQLIYENRRLRELAALDGAISDESIGNIEFPDEYFF